MTARALQIVEKRRNHTGHVRPSHFHTREIGPTDPERVLHDPTLSLYCFDFESREALFVETPPEIRLSDAAFLYDAQYHAATGLLAVPFEALPRLVDAVPVDLSRLTFVHSVARCGSTLVSRALGAVPGVDSLSEPDAITQLAGLCGLGPYDPAQTELLRASIVLPCVPGALRGADARVVKFRSPMVALAPQLDALFPEAKRAFLYRRVAPWTRSFLRLLSVESADAPMRSGSDPDLFGRGAPPSDPDEALPAWAALARQWAWHMERGRALADPTFVFRYEELTSAPHATLAALLAFCGLPALDPSALDAVLVQDSQEGSELSRSELSARTVRFDEQDAAPQCAYLAAHYPHFAGDALLPGTFLP